MIRIIQSQNIILINIYIYNNRKRNLKVGYTKHFALNFLLEEEDGIDANIDYSDFSKIIPNSQLDFVTRKSNIFVIDSIQKLLDETKRINVIHELEKNILITKKCGRITKRKIQC